MLSKQSYNEKKHSKLNLKAVIGKKVRKHIISPIMKMKLKNKSFSIISSTCTGGVICSDVGVRFNSPFINLWVRPKEYIKCLQNLRYYMNCEIKEIKESGFDYPIGCINNEIRLYFNHYKTFNEAKEKWDIRKKRINYDNLFILFTDRNECTEQDLIDFDQLPYKNKIVFTAHAHNNLKSVIWCKKYSDEEEVPIMTRIDTILGKRLYDDYFDPVKWLNENI